MRPEEFLEILSRAAALKTTARHCFTEENRKESVADHSWRTALMAMLLSAVPEFRDVDMDRVIRMCLIHDLGESFTGDVPTFEKTEANAEHEDKLFMEWVRSFPEEAREEWLPLEYGLQLTYGKENVQFSEFLKAVREQVDAWTKKKIAGEV